MDCTELWAVLSIHAHPTVGQLGADFLGQLILREVAAVVEIIVVGGCTVEVEAEGVVCGASPGTRACPCGGTARHVEVQVGLSWVRIELRMRIKIKDRINVRIKVIIMAT